MASGSTTSASAIQMQVTFWPNKPSRSFLDKLEKLVSEEPTIKLIIKDAEDEPPSSKRPHTLDTTDLSPGGSDSVGDTGVIRSRRGGAGAAFRPSRSSAIRGGGGGARGRSSRGGRSSGSRPVRPVGGGGAAGGGDRPPYGYSASPYPSVGGPEPCPHCFCSPCVINNPPTFLVGSCPPDIRNSSKRYPLYRKFWRVLREIGLWRHEPYLVRKATRTSCDDVREIMPTCVTREIRSRYPNPEGIPYKDFESTFDATH